MKIRDITWSNYRRLPDGHLQVRDHLVLVGPNDTGKSSIVRALNICLGMAHGQATAAVSSRDFTDQALPLTFTVTLGIVGRRSTRANDLREAAERAGVTFEDCSTPMHVPAVVKLLNRCVDEATSASISADDELDKLGDLCRSLVDSADAETLYELAGALDVLRGLVRDGASARNPIRSCRSSTAPGAPVAPGVHVLTGHKGKGQEFDWVFVVGLEDGHIPDFRSETDEAQAEELRILHVMVSRARYGVVLTFARQDGWRAATRSPWL